MLNNATGFRKIYIAAGYTDLRRGIDGLASIIKFNFQLDPYEKDILFLFCGMRSDRIKGLVYFRYRNYTSYSDFSIIPTELHTDIFLLKTVEKYRNKYSPILYQI